MANIQDVDLRLLRVFQSVARHRGLSAAQEDLGVTQATISNQLTQLEHRLGFRRASLSRDQAVPSSSIEHPIDVGIALSVPKLQQICRGVQQQKDESLLLIRISDGPNTFQRNLRL